MNIYKSVPGLKKVTITDEMVNVAREDPTKIFAFGLYLTPKCNMKCIFCLSNAGCPKKHGVELSYNKRESLLREARDLGAEQLIISGAGEPLLDRHFWDIIKIAHDELGMHVAIYSNMLLINKDVAAKIASYERLSVTGKKYSFHPETENYLFGGDYSECVSNGFSNLMEAGLNLEIPTRLGFQCAITRVNIAEIPDILRYARDNNLFPQINKLFLAGRAKENPDLFVTDDQYSSLYDKCRRIDLEEYGIKWEPCWSMDNPILAGCCKRPKYWVMVDDLGEMRACSIDQAAVIGNVAKSTIFNVLQENAERVLALRQSFGENSCYVCNKPEEVQLSNPFNNIEGFFILNLDSLHQLFRDFGDKT